MLAHEVGHHVQNLLGTGGAVRARRRRPGRANALSVRMELQADCYAGVWAHSRRDRRDLLEAGRSGGGPAPPRRRSATTASGVSGGVSPESFTHGSSEQRVHWFRPGFEGRSRRLRYVPRRAADLGGPGAGSERGRARAPAPTNLKEYLREPMLWPVVLVAAAIFVTLGAAVLLAALAQRNLFALAALALLGG